MPDRSGQVVSLVSILVDVALHVPALPERGGDVLGTSTRTEVGAGFNLASAVARQGVRCRYAAPHGTGTNGDLVRAALAAEGIEAASAARAEADTGFCIGFIEPDLQCTYVTMPGVESQQRDEDLAGLGTRPRDFIMLSGYDLLYPVSGPVIARWLRSGPAGRLALDPGPLIGQIPSARLDSVVRRLSLLTMNRREAQLITARPWLAGAELLRSVQASLPLNPAALLVIREGADGCLATGGPLGTEVAEVPAPQVDPVDTTGAGDTHTGVLVALLVSGTDVVAALVEANLAAAISVTRLGAATAPTSAELNNSHNADAMARGGQVDSKDR